MPEVSVVITTYNYAQYLPEAINSVLGQSFQDFELIVVDDGSSDNTREIVAGFQDPRLRYIYQANQGVGSARNQGIRQSRGNYLAFLDADDVWLPSKLEIQLKTLRESPQAGVVYTDMLLLDMDSSSIIGPYLPRAQGPLPRGKVLERVVERFVGHPSSLMVKRQVLDKVGLFDESLRNCQDYDLVVRMALDFEFEVAPEPLLIYRIHTGQISRNTRSVLVCHIACFKKLLRSPLIASRVGRILRRKLAEYHFKYGIYLTRRFRLFRGEWELLASLRTDAFEFAGLSWAELRYLKDRWLTVFRSGRELSRSGEPQT